VRYKVTIVRNKINHGIESHNNEKKKQKNMMSSLEPMFLNGANRAFRESQPTTAC